MTEPTPTDDELLALAREAAQRAHCPYSRVRVGAALLAADGRIFRGCNVENASYGLTICAERNAIAHAVAEGVQDFVAVAISSSLDAPLSPCGACRQVLREFGPNLRVVYEGASGARVVATLADLLPGAMGPADLGIGRNER